MQNTSSLFPALKPEDIQVVMTEITNELGGKVTLFVRGDLIATMLDDAFGAFGWEKEMKILPKQAGREVMACTITCYDENGKGISKDGVGLPSEWDPEKGEETDAFKRAAYNWGIARELKYNPPKIYFPRELMNVSMVPTANGDVMKTTDTFVVKAIEYENESENNRMISSITILDVDTDEEFTVTNDRNAQITGTTKATPKTSSKANNSSKKEATSTAVSDKTKSQESTEADKSSIATFKPSKSSAGEYIVKIEGQLKDKKLYELQPIQIAWLYENHMVDETTKKACIAYANQNEAVKDAFVHKGIEF